MNRELFIEALSERDLLTTLSFVERELPLPPVSGLVDTTLEELGEALQEAALASGQIFDANVLPEFGDIDGDGDLDVVVFGSKQASFAKCIYVGENAGGQFVLTKMTSVPSSVAYSADVVDVDLDGSLDVLVSVFGAPDGSPGEVAWYSSVSVTGTFEERHEVFRGEGYYPTPLTVGDFDADGDVDFLAGEGNQQRFRLYENNGIGVFSLRYELESNGYGVHEVLDLDLDGDLDIVTPTTERYTDAGLHSHPEWHENTEGLFVSSPPQDLEGPNMGGWLGDYDGDGDIDFRTVDFWYESNATAIRADVNDDGLVDLDDFMVLVNNFGREDAASKEDGDANADGVVNFADFLMLSANFGEKVRAES